MTKLRGRYRIEVTGDIDKIRIGYSTGIGYLFERLLTGEDAVMENLANWGIEVRVIEGE